jgi:hypothetical protein
LKKDLTNSAIDRKNVLNNQFALQAIQNEIKLNGLLFEGKIVFSKEQIANFFEVSIRTIENYLVSYSEELLQNGYEVLRGKRLQEFKLRLRNNHVTEINFGNMKTSQLGIFDFRSFLNVAMLLVESERARILRGEILDIVIDTINMRTGGGTKYINQRDEDFLQSWFKSEDYRKEFTDALKNYVEGGKYKYYFYTNMIYRSIFKEKASEYKDILKLKAQDRIRDTMYSEILDLIASYECGFAEVLQKESERLNRKLYYSEVDELFRSFESQKLYKPLIEKTRRKMASRDLAFRDALHLQLKEYVTALEAEEFERFLGEKSMELENRLTEAQDVMKRLKERS